MNMMIMLAYDCYGQITSWRASVVEPDIHSRVVGIVAVGITTVVEIRIDLFKLACRS